MLSPGSWLGLSLWKTPSMVKIKCPRDLLEINIKWESRTSLYRLLVFVRESGDIS